MVTERTCLIVAKSDCGESDHSVVDALSERPSFQAPEHYGWDEGEEPKKDGEADEHTDHVLAEWPRGSIVVHAEVARLEEAQIERSTQPTPESSQRHYLQRDTE